MKKRFYSLLSALLFVFISTDFAQKNNPDLAIKSEADIFDEAEFFFGDANYIRAIPLFQKLSDKHPEDALYKFRLGVCYIYKNDEKERSIQYLNEVYASAPTTKDLLFYLGVAYHLNYKFDEAVKYFNDYLATNPPISKRVLVNKYIENCKNGKVMVQTKFKTDIKNLGPVINSKYSEYVPVISSDEAILIFTYRGARSKGGLMDEELKPATDGDYYEDIFISQKVGNEWLIPESIGDNINLKGHDASVALSADGQKLFIFRSTPKDHGDLYMSQLDGQVWSTPERLGPTINTKYWEGSASLSGDEQILYFASERPGGYGKRDIWMTHKLENGEWGEAVNLGPNINTPSNDDAPFIHPDGVTLFFSSEGHNSMGGYDIMYSILESGEWSIPTNLDYPVNTTGDDIFYVLSADGETGYFSSERKGGQGQQDIYIVTPGIQGEKPVLALIVGTTSANGKPVDAVLNVFEEGTDKKPACYVANSATGKYIFSLSPGSKYKIVVGYPGVDTLTENVDLKSLIRYIKIQKDFKLVSPEYKAENNIKNDSSSNSLQANIALQVEEIKKKDEIVEEKTYQAILKKHGDDVKDSVEYTIELGRYEDSTAFNPDKIAQMGKINSKTNEQGITTFSIGRFKTLLEAEIVKYKLLSTDSSFSETATIVLYDHGKRVLVPDYYSSQYTQNRFDPLEEKPIIRKVIQAVVKDTVPIISEPEPIVQETKPVIKDTISLATVTQPEPVVPEVKPVVKEPEPVIKDTTSLAIVTQPEPVVPEVKPIVKEPEPVVQEILPITKPSPAKIIPPVVKVKKEEVKTPPVQAIEPPAKNEEEFAIHEIYSIRESRASRVEHENLTKYFRDKKIKNWNTKYETENPFISLLDEVDAYEKGFKTSSRTDHTNTVYSSKTLSSFERHQPIITQLKSTTLFSNKKNTFIKKTNQSIVPESSQPKSTEPLIVAEQGPCHTDPTIDFSAFAGKDLNDTTNYNKLIRLAHGMCVEGLTFKIQIAAYRHPENFKYSRQAEFGPVETKSYPDGITRFTVREFKTLNEAEAFRQQIIKRGIKDAMVSGTFNEERKLLQDLIAVNFYNRSIN